MAKSNFFILLILGLILGSCSANWHIKKAEQKCPTCFKRDTVIQEFEFKLDTVIKIDTNINVILPRDTVKIDSLVFKTIKPSFNKITQKKGIITTEVEMIKGVLKLNSFLDSSFIYRLQDSIRLKDAKIKRLNKEIIQNGIIIQEKDKKLNKLQKTVILLGIWIVVIIILLIIFRLLKKK